MPKPKPKKPRKPPREGGKNGSYDAWRARMGVKEQRVLAIVEKMQAGAWLSGVSDHALAREWNVSLNTVEHMAAEASRHIRLRLRDDPEAQKEARAQLLQLFQVIRAKCMAKGDPASMRVALDACRAYGFYLGIEPAKRLDVTEHADPFKGWTTEEKLAFANDGSRPRRALSSIGVGDDGGVDTEGEPADEERVH